MNEKLREETIANVKNLADDFVLVLNDENGEPHLVYNTDAVTMAQTAVMALTAVKKMLEGDDVSDQEREDVGLILGLLASDNTEDDGE